MMLLSWSRICLAAERPPVGTNINGLSYWSTQLPLIDSFKTSSAWTSGDGTAWDDSRQLDLDARGWVRSLAPGQVANTVLFSGFGKFPGLLAQRYVVQYTGTGSLQYGGQAQLVEHSDHRDIIAIDTAGPSDATLSLVQTDPSDPLRNICITAEGIQAGADAIFNPIFLERLKGYRALRFITWMLGESADDIAARTWSERPTPEDARWTIKGAPVEIMVALSNRIGADPWFTMPHAADDEYIRRFAQLVRQSLDPKRKVYVEYSNEVWNNVYPQTAYAREQGLARGLSQDPQEAILRFYARRAVEIFSIWEQELGKDRLVRVLSFQADGAPEYSDEIALSFGDTRAHVDVMAIAPYFGTELAADAQAIARTRTMDLDALMQELESSCLPKARAEMLAHKAVADKYGLPMISYEGGQHLWNLTDKDDAQLNALYYAANRDARIGALYSRYLRDWAEAGGGLFMHLLDCGNFENAGNWGALEYITQPRAEAPKFEALQRFMEEGQAQEPLPDLPKVEPSAAESAATETKALPVAASTPRVDAFGQNSAGSWSGKVSSDKEIVQADRVEAAIYETLRAAGAWQNADRDEYQAWSDGPNLGASRFFRVQQMAGGRWWFVAPSGRLFYAIGLGVINAYPLARWDNAAKAAYSWIPPKEGKFEQAWLDYAQEGTESQWPSYYRTNLLRKWDAEKIDEKFSQRAFDRLRAWRFTCLGTWTDSSMLPPGEKFPYFSDGPSMGLDIPAIYPVGENAGFGKIPDVWHPDFANKAMQMAANELRAKKDDAWLIGHYLDNEVTWAGFQDGMLALPAQQPARLRFVAFLKSKYGSMDVLRRAWGIEAERFEDLRAMGSTTAAHQDMQQLLAEAAGIYFDTWAKAIRQADPNHLLVGSRFLMDIEQMPEVLRAAAKVMDVISINWYDYAPQQDVFDRLYAIAGEVRPRPFLIGEYGLNTTQSGLLNAAVPVADEEQRGAGYRHYNEQAAANPNIVGTHYFQYIDEPITGRFDGETSFNGFISVADIPYQPLTQAAKETNQRIYELHNGTEKPRAAEPAK